MEQVVYNPVTGQEYEGFNLKRTLRKAVNLTPQAQYAQGLERGFKFANRKRKNIFGFEGENEDFEGFGLKKTFKRKEGGTFAGNLLRGVASQAKGFIPLGLGNMLPIGEGLMMKKPQIQSAPVESIQMAQTPVQAAQVVEAIAPALSAVTRQTAIAAVQQANTPEDAARVAASISAINTGASKDKDKKKTAYIIGGSIASVLVLTLIVWLIVRK